MSILKFIKFRQAKSHTERRIVSLCSQLNMEGDFLSSPATLDTAENYMNSILNELEGDTYFKKSNSFRVRRTESSVAIWIAHATKNLPDEMLCGFMNKNDTETTTKERYSDEELLEFKEIIDRKLENAQKELDYLNGLIERKEEGNSEMEQEQLKQMAIRQNTFIENLESALVRIHDKTYGICRTTGKLIDKTRLRAVPHATLSLEAKMASQYTNNFQTSNNNNMAKTNSANKSTPKIVAEHHKVENIQLSAIYASKSNPRKSFEKDNIKDLADSMASVGLLQPITVRPFGDKYEIVAGERRWRAAKLLKWDTIPAMVRNVTDEEILEIQIIENLQREDVNPIDEAVAFKSLLEKESLDWLSSRIHKPKKYIVDRLKLNDLVPEAIEYVQKGILPLGHAVVISKLEYSDQQLALKECINDSPYVHDHLEKSGIEEYCSKTLDDLKTWISDHVMLDFKHAPFDIDDDTLFEAAGACSNCPKRTCNNNLLFQEITPDDKCTDGSCFKQKINLHIEREKQRAKEQYGTVLSGETATYGSKDKIKVQGVEVPIQKTPSKNSVPVVITKAGNYPSNRERLGETVYISKTAIDNAKEKKEKISTSGHSSSLRMTWEDSQWEEIKNYWTRFEYIGFNRMTNNNIILMYLKGLMDKELNSRAGFVALALIGIIPGIEDAASARKIYDEFDELDNDVQFKKMHEWFTKLITETSIEFILQLLMMVKHIDDDDEYEVDHDEEFDYSWKELVELLDPSKKKDSSKKPAAKK